jgi:hypothetical protein
MLSVGDRVPQSCFHVKKKISSNWDLLSPPHNPAAPPAQAPEPAPPPPSQAPTFPFQLERFTLDPHMCLLQNVDNLLLSGDNKREVINTTISFINFLGSQGLHISNNRLQFAETEVKYLGHLIRKDQ